jgi:Protein of unknown function (DUF3305)
MKPLYFLVDVVMERVPLENRWVSEQWRPAAVIPVGEWSLERPAPRAPECLADTSAGTTWRFPGRAIELHPSEAEGYHLNVSSETPLVFVMWRPAEDGIEPAARPEIITVSYNEAARIMDAGEKVDPVPCPAAVLAWIRPFVTEHYKPEPRKKMKRNDPFADGAFQRDRGPRG